MILYPSSMVLHPGFLSAPMITVSDNDAANSLVSCLGSGDSTAGMQKVNSFCQSHGYTNTSMGRLLLASNEFGDNYTSAYDCGKFLKEIYQICSGTTQTPSLLHAEEMYSLLKQQQRTNKIPAALPEGVSIANKTGELSDVENDAGILYNAQVETIWSSSSFPRTSPAREKPRIQLHSLAAVFISTIMINLNCY